VGVGAAATEDSPEVLLEDVALALEPAQTGKLPVREDPMHVESGRRDAAHGAAVGHRGDVVGAEEAQLGAVRVAL